jgi:hemerythrin superfamily protein
MATRDKAARTANEMLTDDHKKVKALFKKFRALEEDARGQDEKAAVVKQICDALTVHAAIEEEIFYPAVRAAIDDPELIDEALVEHAGAKALIAQLREMTPDDQLFDAKVTVLGEQIDHHVEEEEGEIFPKTKKAKVDSEELGARLAARKQDLMTELGLDLEDLATGSKKLGTGKSSRADLRR